MKRKTSEFNGYFSKLLCSYFISDIIKENKNIN